MKQSIRVQFANKLIVQSARRVNCINLLQNASLWSS